MRISHLLEMWRRETWRLVRRTTRKAAATVRIADWLPYLGYATVVAGDASVPLAVEAEVRRSAVDNQRFAHPPRHEWPESF
jgi:hypothetical protein